MTQWSDFPDKFLILKCLDYESRCNLRLCSKADLAAVDATEFVANRIEISEVPSQMVADKTMIRVDVDSFSVWFTGVGEITKVDRAWNQEMDGVEERKDERRHVVARRHLDAFFRNGVIEAHKVTIRFLKMRPSENWKLRCDNLKLLLSSEEPEIALEWLRRIDSPLKKLQVRSSNLNGVMRIPQVLNVSESLILTEECDLIGRDLEDLTVTTLDVTSFLVTFHTIRISLQRYLTRGKKKDYMHFEIPLPTDGYFRPLSLLPPSIVMRDVARGTHPVELRGRIVGGYTNEVGNQRDLRFECRRYGEDRLTISIRRDEPQTYRDRPMLLYPFTSKW